MRRTLLSDKNEHGHLRTRVNVESSYAKKLAAQDCRSVAVFRRF